MEHKVFIQKNAIFVEIPPLQRMLQFSLWNFQEANTFIEVSFGNFGNVILLMMPKFAGLGLIDHGIISVTGITLR